MIDGKPFLDSETDTGNWNSMQVFFPGSIFDFQDYFRRLNSGAFFLFDDVH